MKICMFTILQDNFLIAYEVFMKSLLFHNPDFDYDFIILDIDLSNETKQTCKEIYPKVIFRQPDYNSYKAVNMSKTHDRLKCTYYFLDAFRQWDYDRVVSMDMDMLVLGDISELFKRDEPIIGVKAYSAKTDSLSGSINAGVFCINKPYLNQSTYRSLLRIAATGHSMPEQKTMNIFFANKYSYFDKIYNVEKRMLHTKKYKDVLENMKVLHYVGDKPWLRKTSHKEERYDELEKIWWNYYNDNF